MFVTLSSTSAKPNLSFIADLKKKKKTAYHTHILIVKCGYFNSFHYKYVSALCGWALPPFPPFSISVPSTEYLVQETFSDLTQGPVTAESISIHSQITQEQIF